MSELHKPDTPGPWRAEPDRLVDHLGWFGGFSVYSGEGEEIAEVFTAANDAAAIADLWRWVERAERYEAALWEITRQARRHTHSSARIAAAVDELRLIATEALREEGR